jgi:hypothetical protein
MPSINDWMAGWSLSDIWLTTSNFNCRLLGKFRSPSSKISQSGQMEGGRNLFQPTRNDANGGQKACPPWLLQFKSS